MNMNPEQLQALIAQLLASQQNLPEAPEGGEEEVDVEELLKQLLASQGGAGAQMPPQGMGEDPDMAEMLAALQAQSGR